MAAHHPVKDQRFLLNQLRSGLGFINQSIHVCRVMEHEHLADQLSVAARMINSAIIETENPRAESASTCHGYTNLTSVAAVPAVAGNVPSSDPPADTGAALTYAGHTANTTISATKWTTTSTATHTPTADQPASA